MIGGINLHPSDEPNAVDGNAFGVYIRTVATVMAVYGCQQGWGQSWSSIASYWYLLTSPPKVCTHGWCTDAHIAFVAKCFPDPHSSVPSLLSRRWNSVSQPVLGGLLGRVAACFSLRLWNGSWIWKILPWPMTYRLRWLVRHLRLASDRTVCLNNNHDMQWFNNCHICL